MIYNIKGLLVIDKKVRNWCKLPYPGHKKGCPNYNKSPVCPPKIGLVNNIFKLRKKHFLAVVKFNILKHAYRMKSKHPAWSDRQCRCCLYWQNTIRKKLRNLCEETIKDYNSYFLDLSYTLTPEAMGVDVFKSLKKVGLYLERNPQEIIYKVALIGERK
jgi:predicted metal-binding protein